MPLDEPYFDEERALHRLAAHGIPADLPPPKPLAIVNPVELELLPVPDRTWIIQDWLPAGHATANYADGGTGKSLLAQQLQTACATGTSWCGLAVMHCRSFALYCEDDPAELHRRQARINEAFGLRFSDLENMRWISGVGEDNTLATFATDGRMAETDRFAAIVDAAKAFGARLVILDTAADLFAGNENDRGHVRRFIGVLNRVAQDIDGAVLLNAHPSRTGLTTGNLDGGSTAWSNSVRSRWSLARPANDDGQDGGERILTRRKANYATTGATIRLRWDRGVFHAETERGQLHRAAAEVVFLTLLDRCTAAGIRVAASKNATSWAPRLFAKRPDALGYAVRDFDAAMTALFAAGTIEMRTYGRPGDDRRCIARTAA